MKRLRFEGGTGNATVIVPGGQLLLVRIVPPCTSDPDNPVFTWLQINESKAFPVYDTLVLRAADLGNCCGDAACDRFPGDVQIAINFGLNVSPEPETGVGPEEWLVIYNGCD